MEDEGEPLGRAERVEHDQHGAPDRVGHDRFALGVGDFGGLDRGVPVMFVEGVSRRDRRDSSMVRHTREITVVSQARRFRTSPVSVRAKRIQVSWMASSASPTDPSIR
ncbi:hypothetical protein GCM10029992_42810 [Glycomyces albus]